MVNKHFFQSTSTHFPPFTTKSLLALDSKLEMCADSLALSKSKPVVIAEAPLHSPNRYERGISLLPKLFTDKRLRPRLEGPNLCRLKY